MFDRPLTAVPAQRSSSTVLRMKVYAVLGVAVLLVATSLFATVAWIAFTPEVPQAGELVPRGQAVAEIVARDFLAGRRTDVPVADEIDPTFGQLSFGQVDPATRKGIPVTSLSQLDFERQSLTSSRGTQVYEIHTFLVSSQGRLLQLDVTVLLTPDGAVLAAQPALQPYSGPQQDYAPLDYSQLVGSNGPQASQAVVEQVARWARAYATGDSAELRAVAGDQVTRGSYPGLGGFNLGGDVRVVTVVPGSAPNQLVLRVRLLLVSDSAQEVQVSTDYDLLVSDASSSLPKVVAWGPAGAPVLEPYMNNPHPDATSNTPSSGSDTADSSIPSTTPSTPPEDSGTP